MGFVAQLVMSYRNHTYNYTIFKEVHLMLPQFHLMLIILISLEEHRHKHLYLHLSEHHKVYFHYHLRIQVL